MLISHNISLSGTGPEKLRRSPVKLTISHNPSLTIQLGQVRGKAIQKICVYR